MLEAQSTSDYYLYIIFSSWFFEINPGGWQNFHLHFLSGNGHHMGGGLCETHEAPAGDRAVDTLEKL